MDAAIPFLPLDPLVVAYLLAVGFVGGLVSGFIGSGGAFVLTPAMMSLGVPGIVAVASNICHKFPKALVGAIARARYGQVDWKLGIVMGVSAEAGVLYGAQVQENVRRAFGDAGSNLYVSAAFVAVLGIVGGYVLYDGWRAARRGGDRAEEKVSGLARRVQAIHIPYTMMYFRSLNARVSVLFTVPLGFATGMLAATIAVGGFIGVPGMHYVLGAPSLMASATELVIAFVMGLGGTIKYAWSGLVDIRLAMIILAGSLFGIQLGAIGTTYVKPYMIKIVMGTIMILVLFSRALVIPVYLSELGLTDPLAPALATALRRASFAIMMLALASGALIILSALARGMRTRRLEALMASARAAAAGRLARLLVASDGSEFSSGAVREALRLAKRSGARVRVISVVSADPEAESGRTLRRDVEAARAHVEAVAAQAAARGIECESDVLVGPSAHQRIVEDGEQFGADLIVLGRRGRGALEGTSTGETTIRTIEESRRNVLVVPRAAEIHGRGLVVATGIPGASESTADAAGTLARLYQAPVSRVAAADIAASPASNDADVIVLGSHRGSAEILKRARCAVLVVKAA